MVKSRLKKSAPECPFECGGGGVNAIWAMPTWGWRQAERGFPYNSQQSMELIVIGSSGKLLRSPIYCIVFTGGRHKGTLFLVSPQFPPS